MTLTSVMTNRQAPGDRASAIALFNQAVAENVEAGIAIIALGMIKSHPVDEYRREQGCSPSGFP